jgi:peroxiredoxin
VWCPFCNIELKALQAELPNYQALGASLLAISPQTQANSQSQHDNSLSFPILSDPGNAVAAAFGLRYALGDEFVKLHKALNIALPNFNGDDSRSLAMPARYVVGPGGLIRYAEVNPDATRRPEPSDLLPALKGAAARVV